MNVASCSCYCSNYITLAAAIIIPPMDQPEEAFGGHGAFDDPFADAEEYRPAAAASAGPSALLKQPSTTGYTAGPQPSYQTNIFMTSASQEDADAKAKGKRKAKDLADPNKPKRPKKEPGAVPKRQKKGAEGVVMGAGPGGASPLTPGGAAAGGAAAGTSGTAYTAVATATAAAGQGGTPGAPAAEFKTAARLPPRPARSKPNDVLLPKAGVQKTLRNLGMEQDYKLEDMAVLGLQGICEDWVKQVVEVGIDMQKRRKGSSALLPSDMGVYLQRAWYMAVPGPGTMPAPLPYKRPSAETLHAARMAAVCKTRRRSGTDVDVLQ